MEINQLKTFVAIVQTHSFSQAAKKLGYSQAAVTIQIRNLENELACCLFDRLGKQVSLTSKGESFYLHVLNILKEIEEAKMSVSLSEELTGSLNIGTIDSLCTSSLNDYLLTYHENHPHVKVSVTTDSISGLLHKMIHNDIDFVYLVDQPITDSRFVKVFEKEEEACFVCAKSHPLSTKKQVSLEEILKQPLILTERNASYRTLLDLDLKKKGYTTSPIIEAENTDLIISLLEGTGSITFLPHYILQKHIALGTLVCLPIDYRINISRQVLYHKDKWVSPEMQNFISLIH